MVQAVGRGVEAGVELALLEGGEVRVVVAPELPPRLPIGIEDHVSYRGPRLVSHDAGRTQMIRMQKLRIAAAVVFGELARAQGHVLVFPVAARGAYMPFCGMCAARVVAYSGVPSAPLLWAQPPSLSYCQHLAQLASAAEWDRTPQSPDDSIAR